MSARTWFCVGLLCLLTTPTAWAEVIEAGPFSVDVSPALAVRMNGVTLISGDRCVGFRGTIADSPVLVDGATGEVTREGAVITTLARNGRNTLRREAMVTPEAVHITFELRAFGPGGGSHVEYDLLAPVETLQGVPCTLTTGEVRSRRTDSNVTFSSAVKAGDYAFRGVVYAQLALPGGACSLDFNPQGAWQGESNYGEPTLTTPWHDGEQWHFMMLCSGGRFGATITGKVILRAGAIPYDQLHSRAPVQYDLGFPVSLALNFSEGEGDGRYVPCPAQPVEGKPFRWRHPEAVRIVTGAEGGLLYRDHAAPAQAGQEGVLDLELPSGLYLLTLHGYDAEADTGPFSIAGPDGALFGDVRFARGTRWVQTVPLRFRAGKASLRFQGDWKVSALTLQLILGEAEDFLLERPFWNS